MTRLGRDGLALEAGGILAYLADPRDSERIADLLIESGQSDEWNYMPEDEVVRSWLVSGMADGSVHAIKAIEVNTRDIVGAVTYDYGHHFPQYQSADRKDAKHGYISELVVIPSQRRRGIAPQLLRLAIENLTWMGAQEVYAMRHADNVGSGHSMQRAGMVVIDEFEDLKIRTTGSRRTVVTRYPWYPSAQ